MSAVFWTLYRAPACFGGEQRPFYIYTGQKCPGRTCETSRLVTPKSAEPVTSNGQSYGSCIQQRKVVSVTDSETSCFPVAPHFGKARTSRDYTIPGWLMKMFRLHPKQRRHSDFGYPKGYVTEKKGGLDLICFSVKRNHK